MWNYFFFTAHVSEKELSPTRAFTHHAALKTACFTARFKRGGGEVIWHHLQCTEGLHRFLCKWLVRNWLFLSCLICQPSRKKLIMKMQPRIVLWFWSFILLQSTGSTSHSPARTRKLTRMRGRWTPRLSVSPARCTGSFGGAGNARFSGHSARCRWAVSRAGWAGLPASPGGSRCRQHLLTATRLPRCSTSSGRIPHPLSRSRLRSGDPAGFSSRARCRLRLRCGSGAWHHQSGHQVRGLFLFNHACLAPGTNTTPAHVRAQTLMGAETSPNQSAQLLVTHWPPYFLWTSTSQSGCHAKK